MREQRLQRLDHLATDARGAARQADDLERNDQANDLVGHQRADPGGMAQHEVLLQLRKLVGRDARVGEQPEAGVDAIGRRAAVDHCGHHGGAAVEFSEAGIVERQPGRLAQDPAQVRKRDGRAAEVKAEAHLASSDGRLRPLSRAQSTAMS